jgi:RhtB (resistance to homoserine/threonine) family protein
LVIKHAATQPRRVALATTLGINVGVMVHISYCIAGLALIISQTPWLFSLLKYAGASYLIWIGAQALFARRSSTHTTEHAQSANAGHLRPLQAFGQGLLCNLLNPKVTLFFFSVFTQLMNPSSTIADRLTMGSIICTLSLLYWPLLVLFVQHRFIQTLLHRIQRSINRVLGAALIALGAKVALS